MKLVMKKMENREFSSFRDNFGYVYYENDTVFRQLNEENTTDFDFFINSGLAQKLISKNWLINFIEVESDSPGKTLKVDKIPIISYPAEWSFSMLKDAAILTLKIQKLALDFGMTLKDASAYNIQFINSNPIFIDITSFEKIVQNTQWVAYQQFCKHFLAPLALMAKVDISLNSLFKVHLDGIPLPLASKLLPFKAKFNLGIYLHIILHSKFSEKYNSKKIMSKPQKEGNIFNLISNLKETIHQLKYSPTNTEWVDYYKNSVENEYLEAKIKLFKTYLSSLKKGSMWDIGSNDGYFTNIASEFATQTVGSDIDPAAVENFYLKNKLQNNSNILSLVLDITNTDGGFGWNNLERKSIFERIKVDTIVALAIVHHLRITYAIPVNYLAKFFAEKCTNLIIEFVPKTDEKVQILLQNRMDVFEDYTIENFKVEFEIYFDIINSKMIENSKRTLFLLRTK